MSQFVVFQTEKCCPGMPAAHVARIGNAMAASRGTVQKQGRPS